MQDFLPEPDLHAYTLSANVKDFFVDRNFNFLFLKNDPSGCVLEQAKTLENSIELKIQSIMFSVPNSESQSCKIRDSGYGTFLVETEHGQLFIPNESSLDTALTKVPKIDYPVDR